MALRCLLVSLVACLGFELPSGQDVTSWTMSGRTWVSARVVDLSALQAEASGWLGGNDPTVRRMAELAAQSPAPVAVAEAEAPSAPAELAFESITEDLAHTFAADQVAVLAQVAPASSSVPTPVASSAETVDNPELDSMELALAAPSAPADEEEVIMTDEVGDGNVNRLASAVQLTREAVHAWAEVVQGVAEDASLTR